MLDEIIAPCVIAPGLTRDFSNGRTTYLFVLWGIV
jgi:hypothetical protein